MLPADSSRCLLFFAQSSSASRFTAGAAGFLNFSQSGERPERFIGPLTTWKRQMGFAVVAMTFDPFAHTRALLTALEAQGYTHLSWSCAACGLECARGFQLLRIRGRLKKDSTALSVGRQLRCPRCFHRPEPDMVTPSKGRSGYANQRSKAS